MRVLSPLFCLVFAACATVHQPEIDDLKPAVEAFHRTVRWKDFRAAADLVVPERRDSFLKARAKLHDERDLFISDFALDDAKLSKTEGTATAVSHISWYRLPSSTERTETVTSVFVWRNDVWLLESQLDGPFDDLKPAPEKVPAPPPGAKLP
jgi:hypothetical protein